MKATMAIGSILVAAGLTVQGGGLSEARRIGAEIQAAMIADGEFVAPPVKGHVHASTLVPLKGKGEYLAAWFEGSKESARDVAIRGSRRIGGKWEPVRTFAKVNPESPHWNPVLRRADDGRIELFFKVGRNCADWRTYVQESRDEGRTWSAARELVPGDVWGGRGRVPPALLGPLRRGRPDRRRLPRLRRLRPTVSVIFML